MSGASFYPKLFTDLLDVPSSFVGVARKRLGVNSAETALEFYGDLYRLKADFGAVGDGQYIVDGSVTAGINVLNSPSAPFKASDAGKTVFVRQQYTAGPTGSVLATTIATYVSPTQVTLTAPASFTNAAAYVVWGTDDTAAIQEAWDTLEPKGDRLFCESAIYVVNSTGVSITGKNNIHIFGNGRGTQFVSPTGTIFAVHGDGPAYTYANQSLAGYAKGIKISDICLDGMFMGANGTGLLLNFVAFSEFSGIYARNLFKVVEQRGVSRTTFSEFFTPDYASSGIYSQMFCAHWFWCDVSIAGAVENDNTYRTMWINAHKTFFYFKGNSTHYIDGLGIYDIRLFNWGGTWYSGLEGIHIEYGAYSHISKTFFFGSGSHNLNLSNCFGFKVNNNTFWGAGYIAAGGVVSNAINITGNSANNFLNEITDNAIYQPSKHGIYVQGAKNFLIADNNIMQPSQGSVGTYDAVHASSCTNGTIKGVNTDQTGRTHGKDIATSGACSDLAIEHAYPANVDLAGGGSLNGMMAAYSEAGVQQFGQHVVQGSVTLSGGSATVTLTGASVFSSASSYSCVATDVTAPNPVKIVQNSGSSIAFTGTGTDTIRYICIGN